ncbi:uncharacterized protein OCT59_008313 [Rhizophagus irregularis]|uniref:uncharacterized protein n=1 Tax=Rhizophagus irregularis TaxID=588596 RepID=UPI00332A81C7|nr:hypothetical protein OCT59_008313 [Rhizophagus irregularis]
MFPQNIPLTEDNILEYLETNFTNWTSGNEKINSFIKGRQLKINVYDYNDIVLEWIPYNQLNGIEEKGKNGLTTVYSAIWKDGPLYKLLNGNDYTRDSNKKVALKCLHNSQESIDFLINEAKKYSTNHRAIQVLYGISQNPDTGDFIFVQSYTINLTNWISGNEKIDDFIQERQLKINDHDDTIVLEWISYNQFNEIKETGKNGLKTIYSAIWKDGPFYKYSNSSYTRDSNKEVALKCLHNSQESIDSLINEAKKYSTSYRAFQVLYGISQNPDTGDYIFVQNYIFNEIEELGKNDLITVYSAIWKDGPLYKKHWQDKNYTRDSTKEVVLKCLHNSQESIDSLINEAKKYPTRIRAFQLLYGISQNPDTGDYILVQNNSINLVKWISGNEKIDDFIQGRQLKINGYNDIILEWIPYNQFDEIKELGKNSLITVYSAIWKDGPLYKKYWQDESYTRDSTKEVALKCLHNSQESIDSLINEAKKYSINHNAFQVLYGISQNPDTGDYILVQNNYIWTSENEKIDDFIQERQLKINNYDDIVFEWIPYNQFNEIKETSKNGFIIVYSAIWKDGPLYKKYNQSNNYTRDSNKEVALKCLYNSQESIDSLINDAKKYPSNHKAFQALYGISQNPVTGDYILVQNNSINLVKWISGNEKIDDFIQGRQLKIDDYDDIVLEWIPYNQFNEIKEIGKNNIVTVHSAIWRNGPLYCQYNNEYTRDSNTKVSLKCLHNTQKSIDSLINEAKKYPTNHNSFQVLYGISQNPDTGDYILIQNNYIWISENKKIDDFIQRRQLKINNYNDIVLEWIPYNQFNEIKETGKNGLITVYSAIWKDGPLYKENSLSNYTRDSNKEVALKCLHSSQESIDSLINETKKYPSNHKAFQALYGISQDPNTRNYIFVQNNYIWEILEWIPYNQFNKIKEIDKNSVITVYSAIWKDGPLYKKYSYSNYTRDHNKVVSLKCLHNSQESIDILINEAKKYLTNHNSFQVLYGISQNPNTEDYILVQNNYIWISENKKIDDFIQRRQLKINNYNDIILEWIPYNQFKEIKKTGKNDHITVYSAIWKDGPLYKKYSYDSYSRDPNKEVALKCLHNSQKSIDSLINKAKKYLIKHEVFQVLYGISQNPDTGDFIFVLSNTINLTNWISGNEKIDDFIQERQLKIDDHDGDIYDSDNNIIYDNTVLEWIPYNQFNEIKETGKNGLITVYSAIWKDGPLFYNKQYENYTRDSNKEVALKFLHNSQESIDSLINEAKKYSTKTYAFQVLYGISQNPDSGDFIFIQNNCIWTSGNKKIDEFIQERQLKINDHDVDIYDSDNDIIYDDIVLEWIPYNQFNEIKETGKNGLITVYSAIWKAGPLYKKNKKSNYTRDSNKEVALKCFHNSQESIDSLINEAKKYPTKYKAFQVLYGISKNPDTEDYILVLIWSSGNEIVDDFILERQLKINDYNDMIVFEWILYSQFNDIKEIGKGGFSTVYSAEWKNGPLEFDVDKQIYKRNPNRIIALKCLYNSQSITDKFLNEVKEYSINKSSNILNIYGISQNPDTKEYIMVLQYAKDGNFNHWINKNYKYFNWDKNDRPNISEIDKLITLFHESYFGELYIVENEEIEIQFRQAEEYRRANLLSTENYQIVTHPQAIYTSRLLNPITKDLNSQSLDDCALPISFK